MREHHTNYELMPADQNAFDWYALDGGEVPSDFDIVEEQPPLKERVAQYITPVASSFVEAREWMKMPTLQYEFLTPQQATVFKERLEAQGIRYESLTAKEHVEAIDALAQGDLKKIELYQSLSRRGAECLVSILGNDPQEYEEALALVISDHPTPDDNRNFVDHYPKCV
jgi:hypothetical protein